VAISGQWSKPGRRSDLIGRLIQYKLFALRGQPLSILEAGIVNLLFGEAQRSTLQEQMRRLMRLKKHRLGPQKVVIMALRAPVGESGENAPFHDTVSRGSSNRRFGGERR
jgi:hypothetical protein